MRLLLTNICKNMFVAKKLGISKICRKLSSDVKILGIETSCDDTGCAVIDGSGKILGESLYSQHLIHLRHGGIIPDISLDLHRKYIEPAVHEALQAANICPANVDAIAVTVEPGFPANLGIGLKYAKHLARRHNKPLIPIHHMEAHALAARLEHNIEFPFLVLLISGGHSLLAVAHGVDRYSLLGHSIDKAPGEAFDKVARRMKLKNIPEYSQLSGGQAVEMAAKKATDPHEFQFPLLLSEYRDCNFSFGGLRTSVYSKLEQKEKQHKVLGNEVVPEIYNLCASFQMAIARHLVHRTQRAIEFCQSKNILPEDNMQLVISGGVACNDFIFKAFKMLADELQFSLFRPSHRLCVDNGVMIAWNGLEKWRKGIGVVKDIDSLDVRAESPLGVSLIDEVRNATIITKVIKLKGLL